MILMAGRPIVGNTLKSALEPFMPSTSAKTSDRAGSASNLRLYLGASLKLCWHEQTPDASDKCMELTCSACGQEFSYKIAQSILATSDETTTHEVRQRAVCKGCGVRGDNTYQVM